MNAHVQVLPLSSECAHFDNFYGLPFWSTHWLCKLNPRTQSQCSITGTTKEGREESIPWRSWGLLLVTLFMWWFSPHLLCQETCWLAGFVAFWPAALKCKVRLKSAHFPTWKQTQVKHELVNMKSDVTVMLQHAETQSPMLLEVMVRGNEIIWYLSATRTWRIIVPNHTALWSPADGRSNTHASISD